MSNYRNPVDVRPFMEWSKFSVNDSYEEICSGPVNSSDEILKIESIMITNTDTEMMNFEVYFGQQALIGSTLFHRGTLYGSQTLQLINRETPIYLNATSSNKLHARCMYVGSDTSGASADHFHVMVTGLRLLK